MLEKNLEKRLVQEIKKLGGRAYKFVSPGNAGVPDRIVVLKNRAPIFVEMKREQGVLKARQKAQGRRLMKLGQRVEVLYTKEHVERFIEYCKELIQDEF